MDVLRPLRLGLAVFSLNALAACGLQMQSSEPPIIGNATSACSGTAMPNQFIVRWKNGSVSKVRSESEEALARDVLAPNKERIAFAEHDQIVRLQPPAKKALQIETAATPAPINWGMDRVSASTAWAESVQGQGVTVAVVDTGVQLDHPQLSGQFATNPKEVINGIDDDKNGYIDDVEGWDFVQKSPNVIDETGHGTHVSGIIAAVHANGPVTGLAEKAKILPLRFMDASGSGSIADGIAAIYYAAQQGAKIINASWGGSACSKALQQAITDVSAKGVLFISAAGNGDDYGRGLNLDFSPTYPASFGVGLQISVAAGAFDDRLAGFSNFSTSLVHLVAPGVDIYSTWNESTYKYEDGTSMATPFVSGAAALLWSFRPAASAAQVRRALLDGVDSGGYPVSSGGRLNVSEALTALSRLIP